MLEILSQPPGVIALQLTGHVSREDVARCHDLLAQSLESHAKTHLYIEIREMTGFDTEALAQELPRGLRLLGKRDRFGRVAIVSDQGWVRQLSRIESALLPGISYRVYKRSEREQARAWVEGREELPYGHALRILETDRTDVIGVEIDGRLAAAEAANVACELNRLRETQRITGLLLRVKSLEGFEPAIAFDSGYLRMKLGFLHELDRYAVVGDERWLRDWVRFWKPFLRFELRHFEPAAEAAAWEWLGAKPAVEQSEAA